MLCDRLYQSRVRRCPRRLQGPPMSCRALVGVSRTISADSDKSDEAGMIGRTLWRSSSVSCGVTAGLNCDDPNRSVHRPTTAPCGRTRRSTQPIGREVARWLPLPRRSRSVARWQHKTSFEGVWNASAPTRSVANPGGNHGRYERERRVTPR